MDATHLPPFFYEACPSSHATPSSAKWLALSPNKACPTCIIQRIVYAIGQVRHYFTKRGGIFMSRGNNRGKPAVHKMLAGCWRTAKLHGVRVIDLMEELITEEGVRDEDQMVYAKALTVWEEESKRLWKVPGHSYEGDEEEMSEKDKEIVRLMMVLLEETVKKMLRELDEEDMRDRKRVLIGRKAEKVALRSTIHPRVDKAKKTERVQPVERASSMPCLTPTLPLGVSLLGTATPIRTTPERNLSSPGTPASVVASETSPSPLSKTVIPIRSTLKRKSPSVDSCPSPRPHKRVRTASYATVSSEHLTIINPSPFYSPSTCQRQATVQPHRIITLACKSRARSAFRRTSQGYVPGKWASPAFSEKANTSHCKMSWVECEEVTRSDVEEGEESRVFEGLKRVSGAWVVGWWLRNVMMTVDLERVREDALGKGVSAKEVRSARMT
jgi:hypothetical protein